MNLTTKSIKRLLVILSILVLPNPLNAYALDQSLVRGLAGAYAYVQNLNNTSFFQEALEGVIAHIYPRSEHHGSMEIYDVTLHQEQLIASFEYDLNTPTVIHSQQERIVPANFYGEMGPLLVVYHDLNHVDILWFAHQDATHLYTIKDRNLIISYEGDQMYLLRHQAKNEEWLEHYIDIRNFELGANKQQVLSTNVESNQAIMLESNKTLTLISSVYDKNYRITLDMEGFTSDAIKTIEWKIPEDQEWGLIVIEFELQNGHKSRAFYNSKTGMRLYFK